MEDDLDITTEDLDLENIEGRIFFFLKLLPFLNKSKN